ncbi:MAG: hypothetical protein ACRDB1_14615 [Microcoleaceae cyanobacterium]
MSTIYQFKASELNIDFLEEIKAKFGDQEIEIVISELDKTEYLLRSEVNRNRLLQAVDNIKNQQNLIEFKLID